VKKRPEETKDITILIKASIYQEDIKTMNSRVPKT
jgi:hypothetical protein